MNLVTPFFTGEIKIDTDAVTALVIENPKVFYGIVQDIYLQISGEEGNCVLSNEKGILKFSKVADLTTSFVPFELNEKRLITKINAVLEQEAMGDVHYGETMEILSRIEQFADVLSEGLPYQLYFPGINIGSIVKMLGAVVEDDSESEMERVFQYMQMVRSLLGDKLFIFVNMFSFFERAKLQLFFETAVRHEYRVLLIDSRDFDKMDYMRKVIVDKDLCVI